MIQRLEKIGAFEPDVLSPHGQPGVIAYVGLGANLENRREALETALRELHRPPTIEIERVSSLYETAPVGVTNQPDFLNAVARVRTTLPPLALLDALLNLENKMGRVRTLRWGPRVIDLDLVLYGDRQIAVPTLEVPHPRLRERLFVLAPLAEIAPDLALPPDGRSVWEVLQEISRQVSAEICRKTGNIREAGGV